MGASRLDRVGAEPFRFLSVRGSKPLWLLAVNRDKSPPTTAGFCASCILCPDDPASRSVDSRQARQRRKARRRCLAVRGLVRLSVEKPLALCAREQGGCAFRIGHVAGVGAEIEFGEVAVQMRLADVVERADRRRASTARNGFRPCWYEGSRRSCTYSSARVVDGADGRRTRRRSSDRPRFIRHHVRLAIGMLDDDRAKGSLPSRWRRESSGSRPSRSTSETTGILPPGRRRRPCASKRACWLPCRRYRSRQFRPPCSRRRAGAVSSVSLAASRRRWNRNQAAS